MRLEFRQEVIDTTNFLSGGYQQQVAGLIDVTFTF